MKSFGLNLRGPVSLASSGWRSRIAELETDGFTAELFEPTIRRTLWDALTISRNHDCIRRGITTPATPTLPDETRAAIVAPESVHPLRLMVVEDDKDTADSLALLLSHRGIDVRVCRSGVGALSAALTYRPDVVLIDIVMPGMDGYQIACGIREHEELKDTLLIATTGLGDPDNLRLAQEAGFTHHLLKPWVYPQLQEILATSLRKDARF